MPASTFVTTTIVVPSAPAQPAHESGLIVTYSDRCMEARLHICTQCRRQVYQTVPNDCCLHCRANCPPLGKVFAIDSQGNLIDGP